MRGQMRRLAMIAVAALGGLFTDQAIGQIEDQPDVFTSLAIAGKPTKVDLPNGNYKLVYKNADGQTVKTAEFEPSGSMLIHIAQPVNETSVVRLSNDGRSFSVRMRKFEDHPEILGRRRPAEETVLVYRSGFLYEKSVYPGKMGHIDYHNRTVTRYTPAPDAKPVTTREKLDLQKDEWVEVSMFAGKWVLFAKGQEQPWSYSFVESLGVTELRQEGKTWLLVFGIQSQTRNVVLPAAAVDHFRFTRRLIQLRGDAATGCLEFWLTPDLTTMNFEKTDLVLRWKG